MKSMKNPKVPYMIAFYLFLIHCGGVDGAKSNSFVKVETPAGEWFKHQSFMSTWHLNLFTCSCWRCILFILGWTSKCPEENGLCQPCCHSELQWCKIHLFLVQGWNFVWHWSSASARNQCFYPELIREQHSWWVVCTKGMCSWRQAGGTM